MSQLIWIAAGSALGGLARHGLTLYFSAKFGTAFPWGTLAVNVVGSGLIGALAGAALHAPWLASEAARNFLMTGVLGGFTTFSAFSLQMLLLSQEKKGAAGTYLALTLVLCLGAVWAGYAAGSRIFSPGKL